MKYILGFLLVSMKLENTGVYLIIDDVNITFKLKISL